MTNVAITNPGQGDHEAAWAPLKKVVPADRCDEFMFMGTVPTTGGDLFLYKNITTRRYLNLDSAGNGYRRAGDQYVLLGGCAVMGVLLPGILGPLLLPAGLAQSGGRHGL